MAPLQPLGYTLESVQGACSHINLEAHACLERIEQALATVRMTFKRLYPDIEGQISGWRDQFASVSAPPDASELEAFAQVSDTRRRLAPSTTPSTECDLACERLDVYRAIIPKRFETLKYMRDHDASFHYDLLYRTHSLLAERHPETLQGGTDLGANVIQDLHEADSEFSTWQHAMSLMLYGKQFMNGVTWPPDVGDALPLFYNTK